MRALVPGLTTPAPLAGLLPAMLREDPFAQQLCAGLDEVLAPVMVSLDSFAAYLDLGTAPDDMLPWLAQWVGLTLDDSQDPRAQRELVGAARELHAIRGTRVGVQQAVQAAVGLPTEVYETGGCAWSERAGGDLPGEPVPAVVVIVRPGEGVEVDTDKLEAIVGSVVPAHVQFRVQVAAA